jgi:hypothetical protein
VSDVETDEVKTRSFSIRLTPKIRRRWRNCATCTGWIVPAASAAARGQALAWRKKLGKSGYFVPAGESQPPEFLIRLERKDAHE